MPTKHVTSLRAFVFPGDPITRPVESSKSWVVESIIHQPLEAVIDPSVGLDAVA